jgi:4-hydroxybenzoate polyprenyltransferase
MVSSSVTSTRSGGPSVPAHLLRSLRPHQWTKNLIVFAGLMFGLADTQHAGTIDVRDAIVRSLIAFVVFCVLSGVVYLINDLRDAEADRRHPTKSRRPIASGALPPRIAMTAAAVLSAIAVTAAFLVAPAFGLVASSYLVLLSLYSATLKHMVILDVLTIAMGFVLRALGGAVAIGFSFSHWLLLLTLLGALFLALSKRRAELVTLAHGATSHRRILAEYSPVLLDQMISVVTASTLLAYAFYTIDPDTVRKFGTDRLVWTIPFPLYGIFRYLYLVHQQSGGGNPSEVLLTDRPILVCVALWGAAVMVILYGPWR